MQKRGRTALHAAVESENMEIIKCLINASPASRDITDIVRIIILECSIRKSFVERDSACRHCKRKATNGYG